MNKEFCMSCGHKNLFEVSRPKFCAGCGQRLNSTAVASSPSKKIQIEESDERETDINIESLDFDALRRNIAYEGIANKISLNDLWSNPAPRENFGARVAPNAPEGKALLKEIEQQCSSSKSKEVTDA